MKNFDRMPRAGGAFFIRQPRAQGLTSGPLGSPKPKAGPKVSSQPLAGASGGAKTVNSYLSSQGFAKGGMVQNAPGSKVISCKNN